MYPSSLSDANKHLKSLVLKYGHELSGFEHGLYKYFEESRKHYLKSKENFENSLAVLQAAHEKADMKKNILKTKINHLQNIISIQKENLKVKEDTINISFSPGTTHIQNLQDQLTTAKSVKKDLENFLSFYESGLGLEIYKSGEVIEFKFHHISQTSKNEHIIGISFSNGCYTISKCLPHLEKIEGLLEELNYLNDLSRFIRSVRNQFKSLYY
jgi:Chromosome segregation protein Spc25